MTKKTAKKSKHLQPRPPIVVILGHVDHGKTSILDYIRQTKTADKESGGITQHIGAYQIKHQNKDITFIDTPGHEAFSAMRSRGAKVADIAVLVVAAEEGVKPQTKEAIEHIKKIGLPAIVALNKIDKKEALPEKVKKELAANGLAVESAGGQIPSVNLSAKTGQGIDQLLEIINLVAEMEELKSDGQKPAQGVIIESHLDALRGPTATLLVKDGTLKNQDVVGTSSAFGKVKAMQDFQSQPIAKATASQPVIMTGFGQVPQIGEKFNVFKTLEAAQAKVAPKTAEIKKDENAPLIDVDKKTLNLILKADVQGSLEAIRQSLKSIPSEEVTNKILKAEVGQISESDVKLAESTSAKIIGFRVKNPRETQQLAELKKVKILTYDIIYELIQGIREMLIKLLAPEIVKNVIGQIKILALFTAKKERQVIGGKVISGQAKKGVQAEVIRDNKKIGQGKIIQLQRNKNDVAEVAKSQECGMMFESQIVIDKGDVLELYEEEKKQREL